MPRRSSRAQRRTRRRSLRVTAPEFVPARRRGLNVTAPAYVPEETRHNNINSMLREINAKRRKSLGETRRRSR